MDKEQKINKYLSVKLVKGQVYTYINNERFLKCRHAIMNIPIKNIDDYEGFDSIDDIIEYNRKQGYFQGIYTRIDPETDFMVHKLFSFFPFKLE